MKEKKRIILALLIVAILLGLVLFFVIKNPQKIQEGSEKPKVFTVNKVYFRDAIDYLSGTIDPYIMLY